MEPLCYLIEGFFLLSLSMYPIGLMLGSDCCCGGVGGGIPVDCFGDTLEPRCIVGKNSYGQQQIAPGFVNFSDIFLSRQPPVNFHTEQPERHGVVPDSTSFSAYITHGFRSLQRLSYGEYVEYTATPKLSGSSYPYTDQNRAGVNYYRNGSVTLSSENPSIVIRGWDWHFYPDTGEVASPFSQTQEYSQTHFSASTLTESSNRTTIKSQNAPLTFSVVGLAVSGNAGIELTVSQLINAVTFTVEPNLDFQVSVSLPKTAFNHSQGGAITWTVRVYKGIAYRDRTLTLNVSSSGVVDPPPPVVPLIGDGVYLVPIFPTPPQPEPPADYYENSGLRFVGYDRSGSTVAGQQRILVPASQSTVDVITEMIFEIEQSSASLIPGRLTEVPQMSPYVRTVGGLMYDPGSYWVVLQSPRDRSTPVRYTQKDSAKVAAFMAGTEILSFPGPYSGADWGAVQPTAFCTASTRDLPYQLFPQTVTMSREDGSRVVQDKCGFMQETSVTLDYVGGTTYANYDYSDEEVLSRDLISSTPAINFLYGFYEVPTTVTLPAGSNPALASKVSQATPPTLDTPHAALPESGRVSRGYAGFHPPKTITVTIGEGTFEYFSEVEGHEIASGWELKEGPAPTNFGDRWPDEWDTFYYYEFSGPGTPLGGNPCPASFGDQYLGVYKCGPETTWAQGFGGVPNPHKELFKSEVESQLQQAAGTYVFTLSGGAVSSDDDIVRQYSYVSPSSNPEFNPGADYPSSLTLSLECDLSSGVQSITLFLPVNSFAWEYRSIVSGQGSYPHPGYEEVAPYFAVADTVSRNYRTPYLIPSKFDELREPYEDRYYEREPESYNPQRWYGISNYITGLQAPVFHAGPARLQGYLVTESNMIFDATTTEIYTFYEYYDTAGVFDIRYREQTQLRFPPGTKTRGFGRYRWKVDVPVSITYGDTPALCNETASPTSYGPGPISDYPPTQTTDNGICGEYSKTIETNPNSFFGSSPSDYNPSATTAALLYDSEVYSFGGTFVPGPYGSSYFDVDPNAEVFLLNKTNAPVEGDAERKGSIRVKGVGTFDYTVTVQYEGAAFVNDCKVNKENEDRIVEGDKCRQPQQDGVCRDRQADQIYDPDDLYYDYDFFDNVSVFKSADATHEVYGLAPDGCTVGLRVQKREDGFTLEVGSAGADAQEEIQTTTASDGTFSFSWSGDGDGDYYFYVYALGSVSGTTTNLPNQYFSRYFECNPASSCEKFNDDFAGRLSVTSSAQLPGSYGFAENQSSLIQVEGGYLSNQPVSFVARDHYRTSSVRMFNQWRDAFSGISLGDKVAVDYDPSGTVTATVTPDADIEGRVIQPEIECFDEVGNSITGTIGDLIRFDITPPEFRSLAVNGVTLSSNTYLNSPEQQQPLAFSGLTDPGATVELLSSNGQTIPGATATAAGGETIYGQEGTGEFSFPLTVEIPIQSSVSQQLRATDVAGNSHIFSYRIYDYNPYRSFSALFLSTGGGARVIVTYSTVQEGSYGRITIYENGVATDYRDILVTSNYMSKRFEFNAQGFWHQITPTLTSSSDVVTISRSEDLTKFGPGWEVLSELKASAGTGVRAVSVADVFVDYFATPVQSSSFASVVITRSQNIETLLDYLENAEGGVFALSSISLVDGLWETDEGSRLLEINDEFADYEITPIQSSQTDTIIADVPLSEAQSEGIGPGWYLSSSLVLTGTPAVAIQGTQVQSISEAVDSDGVVIGTEIKFDSNVNATSGATIVLRKYFGYKLQFDKNVTAAQGQQMTLRGFTGFEVTFNGSVAATQGEPIALMTNAAISLNTELYLFNGYQTLEETFGVLYS